MVTMLCNKCLSVFNERTLDEWLAKTSLRNGCVVLTGKKWLPHQPTVEAVHEAAGSGCYVCRVVVQMIPNLTTGTAYKMGVSPKRQAFTDLQIVSEELPLPEREGRLDGRATFRQERIDETMPALSLSRLSLREPTTGRKHCLDLAAYWLDVCCHTHERCSVNRTPVRYPTRVLKLSGNAVRLIDTGADQPSGPYATLSHRWGGHPIDVLTPGNKADFQTGKLLQDLPPTFRDFCKTCSYLGIYLLWIDSFCILQGTSEESIEDWERESVLMEQVYANSLINIGASYASDSQGGLFQHRSVLSGDHFIHWKACKTEPSQTYALVPRRDPDAWFNYLPLFSRAWVVQERILSPRMLHFGKDQLWWQCAEEPLLCEKYPGVRQDLTCTSVNTVRPAGIQEYRSRLQELWHGIMNVYSGCNLTMPQKDKQRAIEGIGSRIASTAGDTYVQGFFWGHLPRSLCWQVSHDVEYAGRSCQYRAASWSWASMDGQLYFDPSMNEAKAGEELAAAVCINAYQDEARTTRHLLICIGKLLPVTVCSSNGVSESMLAVSTFPGQLRCILDDHNADALSPHARLAFLPIYANPDEDIPNISKVVGLVLSQCLEGTWRRVGLSANGPYEYELLLQKIRAAEARCVVLD